MPHSRILVVDDNPVNLGVLVDNLEVHGYDVLVALGGHEALDRARFAKPDLVLLDVMMPDLDGFETCRRMKALDSCRDIPVIFMTALTDVDSKIKAFSAGGVDYVSKPFQIEELIARVRTHLALRAAQLDLLAQKNSLEVEVAARHAAEDSLRESEVRHRRLFETAADGILVLDCDANTVYDLNARCGQMLGVDAEEVRGRYVEDIEAFRAMGGKAIIEALRASGQMKWDEWTWQKPDGSTVSVEVLGTTYRAGPRLLAQCTFRDIRARKEAEARIRYLALHDALTGLPNRTLLMDRLSQAIAHARRDNSQVALLLLDLDHFKHINDSLGHYIGDELLEEVSRRLRAVVREVDTPARLGGDEFVVAAAGINSVEDAEILALAARVRGEPAPEQRPRDWGRLTVRRTDGRTATRETTTPLGSPARPLSEAQSAAKFRDCAANAVPSLDRAVADRILARLSDLENLPDAADLVRARA